jgi:NAD-dependent dihydropyrimidine dehydrogenase PreA subunit
VPRRRLFRASTRSFWREGRRTRGYSFTDFLHGYAYGRWPYRYIGWAKGDRKLPALLKPFVGLLAWLFLRDAIGGDGKAKRAYADRYHGKVVPTDAAEQLVALDAPIELRDLERIVPYATARDIVMSEPEHIVALECPCRSGREEPCLPLDVCLIVGEPFASFVADHHPAKARWISQQEAADILRAERDRGHVHHAFFKDAMLQRFYAICNCCSCCCGAMLAFGNGTPMLASSGYVCEADSARCVACGSCVEACPFGALAIEDGALAIDVEACMGCGVCVAKCPQEALSLTRDPAKGEPLRIEELLSGSPAI